jgi:hypothetical protein
MRFTVTDCPNFRGVHLGRLGEGPATPIRDNAQFAE